MLVHDVALRTVTLCNMSQESHETVVGQIATGASRAPERAAVGVDRGYSTFRPSASVLGGYMRTKQTGAAHSEDSGV